jgi:hypothetical protein
MAYAAQRQFRVTVSGFPGFWSMASGGSIEATETEVYDGGRNQAYKISGSPKLEKVTLKRPFDPERHSWLKDARQSVGKTRHTIVITPIDADEIPVTGAERTFVNCLFTKLNEPDVDAASNNAAEIEIELSPEEID